MVEGREPQTPRQARREVVAVLADLGFDPKTDSGAASVALRRCPLLDVARTHGTSCARCTSGWFRER